MNNNCECQFDGFEVVRCEHCLNEEGDSIITPVQYTAGEIMETLLESGSYQRMKMTEDHTKSIKKNMRKALEDSESKRHEFKKHNLVAKFVPTKVMDIDYQGLNEFLNDVGLLVPTVKMDHKDIKRDALLLDAFSPYQLKKKHKLHIAFNKAGKEIKTYPVKDFDQKDLEELILAFNEWDADYKRQKEDYEETKKKMLSCSQLQQQKKVGHKYGSLSLVELDPEYNISQIYEELGADFLIRYGKPNSEKLQEFVYKGLISQKDIDQFRQIVDIKLKFMVLTLDAEERMLSMLDGKKTKAIQSRYIG